MLGDTERSDRSGGSGVAVRVYENGPRRRYADVLRSLGAQLDEAGARDILLVELTNGFLLQAAAPEVHSSRYAGMSIRRRERVVDDDAIARAVEDGYGRRGTGRVAGPLERALRIIGRHVDTIDASQVLIIQEGAGWLLRCRPGGHETEHVFVEIVGDQLQEMHQLAMTQREPARPKRRFPW